MSQVLLHKIPVCPVSIALPAWPLLIWYFLLSFFGCQSLQPVLSIVHALYGVAVLVVLGVGQILMALVNSALAGCDADFHTGPLGDTMHLPNVLYQLVPGHAFAFAPASLEHQVFQVIQELNHSDSGWDTQTVFSHISCYSLQPRVGWHIYISVQ